LLVQEILKLGGIPFVKTNVPQTLMSFECSNPLWGTTSNPIDVSLSPGGSSGGEAALIASKGSIIGIGRYF
jgi:Asp-tRNA(Asn)/Glu-tRNA(Gln) amidotransferase A subunit family amidase